MQAPRLWTPLACADKIQERATRYTVYYILASHQIFAQAPTIGERSGKAERHRLINSRINKLSRDSDSGTTIAHSVIRAPESGCHLPFSHLNIAVLALLQAGSTQRGKKPIFFVTFSCVLRGSMQILKNEIQISAGFRSFLALDILKLEWS